MNSKDVCSVVPHSAWCSIYLLASAQVPSSEEKVEEAPVQNIRKIFLVSFQWCKNYFCGISNVAFLLLGEGQVLIETVKLGSFLPQMNNTISLFWSQIMYLFLDLTCRYQCWKLISTHFGYLSVHSDFNEKRHGIKLQIYRAVCGLA